MRECVRCESFFTYDTRIRLPSIRQQKYTIRQVFIGVELLWRHTCHEKKVVLIYILWFYIFLHNSKRQMILTTISHHRIHLIFCSLVWNFPYDFFYRTNGFTVTSVKWSVGNWKRGKYCFWLWIHWNYGKKIALNFKRLCETIVKKQKCRDLKRSSWKNEV